MRILFLSASILLASFAVVGSNAQVDSDCADATAHELPVAGRDGSVLLRVINRQLETDVRLCLIDEQDRRVFDATVHVDAASKFDQRVWVPIGEYRAVYVIQRGAQSATLDQAADLRTCPTGSMLVEGHTSVSPTGLGVSGGKKECESAVPVRPADAVAAPPVQESIPVSSASSYAWGAVTAVAGVGLLLALPRPRYFLLALFSRVRGPDVLDQPTRGDIYTLVRQSPGVNAHRVANSLKLGSGETRYHLSILRRNHLITEIRRGTMRCYFPTGLASPEQLRATAILHHAGAERLYDALLALPNSSLTALASRAGLRLSAASKALAKLVEGGLAERVQEGRELRIRPTAIRALFPLFEANPSSESLAVS